MYNRCKNVLEPIDIIVTAGVSVVIIIPEITLFDKRCFSLEFCLTRPEIEKLRLAQGIEVVLIRNGVNGTDFVVEDCAADVMLSNELIVGYCYRIRFGNNGAISTTAGGLSHYIVLNTPKCKRQIDLANGAVATTTEV